MISIIMGVYNRSKTIRRAIDSIINQTFTEYEFIICDDCSTDNTADIVKEYSGKDSRILYIKNDKNSGLAYSLNHCLSISKGDYIARMDDDDYAHPDRLEKELEFIKKHPEFDIVGTSFNLFDEEGIWGRNDLVGELKASHIFSGKVFAHPTVIMKRDSLMAVGGYTVAKRTFKGQDFDLWCKMYSAGCRGYVMEELLFDYYDNRYKLQVTPTKYRFYKFITHMKYRKKMGLPLWYDIYAWKEILAAFVPQRVIAIRQHKRYGK